MNRLIATAVIALVCGPASAQSINIDFGSDAGQPDVEFLGAANQDGVWNTISPSPGVPVALLDLAGNATSVTITTQMTTGAIPDDQIVGDNEALLEDGLFGNGDVVRTFTFDGLEDGAYTVLVYGFTPTHPSYTTTVIPPAGITGIQPIGGAWPGNFQTGVTHGSFDVDVVDGTLTIEYVGSIIGAQGFVNGLQITQTNSDVEQRPEDLNSDGVVGVLDLFMLLNSWTDGHGCDGIDGSCPADFNGDRQIDVLDLFQLLSAWG